MKASHKRALVRLVSILLGVGVAANAIGQQKAGKGASDIAQSYPTKPIRIVTPYTSGSPVDALARVMAHDLSTRLAQGVIVDNRPGAGTTIGNKSVAAATPDGYTLLITSTGSLAFTAFLYPDAGYDAVKSFAPVATLVVWSHVLIATPQLPANNMRELVDLARAQPGKITIGYGLGTTPSILAEIFRLAAKADIVGIPFKGGAQAVSEMLGGRIDTNIGTVATLLPLIRQGKVKAIAFTGRTRSLDLPDVPTTAESGFPEVGFYPDVCHALFAPSGTPTAVINRLNAAVNAGLASPELKATLTKFGFEPNASSPQELGTFMVDQVSKWPSIIKATGVRPD
jgi:tripartite-type tricarboxylate transporter receptor subunit TctC